MESVVNFLSTFWDWLAGFWQWLIDVGLYVPRVLFAGLMDGAASIIETLPSPSFLGDINLMFGGIPGGVWWFANSFEFGAGLGMVGTALLLRFVLRRIPFVG